MCEQSIPEVQYRPIVNFPGYRVGDDGSVWSCRGQGGNQTSAWRQLKALPHKTYGKIRSYTVALRKSGKTYRVSIHRIVLEAFVGQCPEGMECCHEDGDNSNNRVTNLRWDTHWANGQDTIRHGTSPRGENHHNSLLTPQDVREIRIDLRTKSQSLIAKERGICQGTVSAIKCKKTWAWLE
jgi:hypothetical protein